MSKISHHEFRYGSALRLLTLVILLTFLQPAPVLITYGENRPVTTNLPILGVHTRLTDEVEEWKIQRTLEMVREMGAPWIVELFPWAYYHGEDGGFAWAHPDMVINHANSQGLEVIARLGLTPSWARPPDTSLNYLNEEAYEPFGDFAAAFAERYRGKADHIIIWNEPNLSFEWGYQKSVPEDYVGLLRSVYPKIKAANPDAVVLAGALAPTLEPAGSPWGMNDLEYLDAIYELNGADYFDGLAVHAYGLTFPPESEPDADILNFRRIELIRDVMLKNDDEATKIFITETGWNDHPRWSLAVSPGQRIQYSLDAIEHAKKNWPYVELLAFWSFRYPAPTKSYPDYFTFVTPEFVAKPVYDALRLRSGN